MNYFDKIPSISYDGYTVKNLLARAKLSNSSSKNRLIFYPYTAAEEDRADTIAQYYYNNPGYSWLVWFSNEIIDPYYGMHLSEDDFNSLLTSKYGSTAIASRKIKCYRNNWYNNLDTISSSSFAGLNSSFKKYYDPVVDRDFQIISYTRKRHDDIVNTNRSITVSLQSNASFKIGEEIGKDSSNYGFVTFSSGNTVGFQHVTGSFNVNDVIRGVDSLQTAVISSIIETQTIAAIDAPYWEAVSFYDYESDINTAKKELQLIDARYASSVESDLRKLLGS